MKWYMCKRAASEILTTVQKYHLTNRIFSGEHTKLRKILRSIHITVISSLQCSLVIVNRT